MRIFICADMEGITGVVHREQLMPEGKQYAEARGWMTADINAAIEGALREAPEATFLVNDGHAVMRNVLLDSLHDRAELIVGPATWQNKPLCQTTGIDSSFDLLFLVGHHTRSGTPGGLLSHTWSGQVVANFWIQGQIVGEVAINSATAGAFNVPVGLVTGTDRLMEEAKATLPTGVVGVQTKVTLGPTAAICKTPRVTHAMIADGAAEAVRRLRAGQLSALTYDGPVHMEIETYRREMTQRALRAPNVKQTGESKFDTTAADAATAAGQMWHAVVRAHDETPGWLN
ncbi:MAG: M55 family metallopeptidase [Myxococcota bacterium]